MTRIEELEIQNMQDIWSKFYLHLAKELIEELGVEGEKALRQGIRNFGVDRGLAQWEKHKALGMKRNLYNLFSYGDLPNDSRFRRNRMLLTTQQRFTETLVCPLADMWEQMGGKYIGRIYCEEFHHAKFAAYAPKVQVNLSQTLTQEGDNHCRFSVYLRPSNMNEDERQEAFPEYDSDYKAEKVLPYEYDTPKNGFGTLIIKIFYHLANTAEALGEPGQQAIINGAKKAAADIAQMLKERAKFRALPLDEEFLEKNTPFYLFVENELAKCWGRYENKGPQELYGKYFVPELVNNLNLK